MVALNMKGLSFNKNIKYALLPAIFIVVLSIVLISRHQKINTFQKASPFSGWDYQASLSLPNTTVSAKTTQNSSIINFQYQNSSLQFDPPVGTSTLSQDKKNEITFTNKEKNISAQYQILDNGLKENIILQKIPDTNQFTSTFQITNADIYLNSDNLPVFLDPFTKKYLFHIQKPYATDAVGNKTYAVSYQIKEATSTQTAPLSARHISILGPLIKISPSSNYTLVVKVDSAWLFDKNRVYPITIDPTIVHDTSSEFATGQFNRVKNTDTGTTNPALESYYQELPADSYTIGLWHLNESIGTTVADYSGNSYTGTLTGTSAVTGMLGIGRSFNGTSDKIVTSLDFSRTSSQAFTVSAWINVANLSSIKSIIGKSDTNWEYNLEVSTTGQVQFIYWNTAGSWGTFVNGSGSFATGPFNISTNTWYHIALVYNGSSGNLYINGIPGPTFTGSGTWQDRTNTTTIGYSAYNTAGAAGYFSGSIDEVTISNRAYSAEEIKLAASRRPYSTFTSDVIDLTNVSAWNSLSWTGAGITTGNGETLASTTGLVAQWNFNETVGTSAVSGGSCGTSCNGTLTNFANLGAQDTIPASGWTTANRRWGTGALTFDGVNDYVNIGTTISNIQSIEFWIKPTTANNGFIQFQSGIGITSNTTGLITAVGFTSPTIYVNGIISSNLTVGVWNFITVTTNIGFTGNAIKIGNFSTAYTNGIFDSTRIYSRALTAAEILSNYNSSLFELQTRVGTSSDANDGTWEAWKPSINETTIASMDSDSANWSWDLGTSATFIPQSLSNGTTIKMEGTSSLKIQTGIGQTDANTVALWHLDETGIGTGTTFYDSTSNNNYAIATGTTVVDGISNKARSFNGTSDKISVTNSGSFDLTTYTWEVWVKPTWASGTNGYAPAILALRNGTNTRLSMHLFDNYTGITLWNGTGNQNYTYAFAQNNWYHIAFTYSSGTSALYVNGALVNSASYSQGATTTLPLYIGCSTGAAEWFKGSIDEVRISNVTRTAEYIAESYRLGRDHRLSKTISSTNLSSVTKLPFYVASDRLGTFSQLTIGESLFANYEPDANTLGLWHLDEQSGSGAYLKDSSGNSNNGTPTGTIFTRGYIGGAHYFNGTSSYIYTTTLFTNPQLFTLEAWFQTNSASGKKIIGFENAQSGTGGASYDRQLYVGTDGKVYFGIYSGGIKVVTSVATVNNNQWHHVVGTFNGSVITLYLDGVIQGTLTAGAAENYNGYWRIGSYKLAGWTNGSDGYFPGTIDEVRISNIARTADEIRQAYEIGARTHNITIDFKAKLNSGNLLVGSTDYSFTVDETTYGSSAMASHIFLGDKIIVKENIGGTEFIAQGLVNSVNSSTGAVTVSSWDSGSTFPSGGFTINATVFKWQREYFDITNSLSTHRDAITRLTYRITDGSLGANIWLDDLRSSTDYLNNSVGSTITSSLLNHYFQYRTIFTQNDLSAPSSDLNSLTLDYASDNVPNTPTNSTPANGTSGVSFTPTLTASSFSDPDAGDTQSASEWQVATDSAFTSIVFDTGTTGSASNSVSVTTALSVGTTYYWHLRYQDNHSVWSEYSSYTNFTTSQIPNTPTLDYPSNTATNQLLLSVLKTTASDTDSDALQYRVILCTNSTMTTNCQSFDQTASSTGWSATSYTSGIQATYTLQAALSPNTIYYWKSQAIDPNGSNNWSATQISPYSFTTTTIPHNTYSCLLEKSVNNSFLRIKWLNISTTENGLAIEKKVDSASFVNLVNLSTGTTGYIDTDVSSGHVYQYRIAPYFTGPIYGDWCNTPIVDLRSDIFKLNGNLNFNSININ
jgi:hypothetical protein